METTTFVHVPRQTDGPEPPKAKFLSIRWIWIQLTTLLAWFGKVWSRKTPPDLESPQFVYVRRQTDSPEPTETKSLTIHWRMVMILLTPLLLALANLVEAHFEKLRGFEVGKYKYEEFQGRGRALRDGLIKGAIEKGDARYAALIAAAQNESKTEIEVGRYQGQTSISQGHAKGAIPESLATGMIVALMGRTPDIARLAHESAELELAARSGRYLQVDSTSGRFEVREVATTEQAHMEMIERVVVRRKVAGRKISELTEQSISEGARELASSAGATLCSSH